MAVTSTTTLANTYRTHFSKKLLQHAVQELRKAEFAKQAELPANMGSKVIRFFQPGVADATSVGALDEGVAPTTFRDVTYSYVDVTLVQYGEVAKITDIVDMTGLFDALQQSIKTMGEDCALHADEIIRNVIAHQTTGLTKRYAQGLADFAALVAASTANGRFVTADLLDACTRLKINRAPRIGGRYVAIAPPQVTRDLQRDDDWLDAAKYSNVQALYKGEVGMIYGVRVVEDTNPFIESDTLGTYASAGGIFSTFVVGEGAYGCPKLAGTQSPWTPKVTILDKADKSDPLNQTKLVGWKSFWAAKVLNANFGVTIRSKSGFSG